MTEGSEAVIRVKGEHEKIESVLKNLYAVKKYERLEEKEKDCEDYNVVAKEGYDIREVLYKAFALEEGLTLLQLYSKEISLENTFLALTGQNKKGRA